MGFLKGAVIEQMGGWVEPGKLLCRRTPALGRNDTAKTVKLFIISLLRECKREHCQRPFLLRYNLRLPYEDRGCWQIPLQKIM
jgi:hypothetical protein